MFFNTFGNKTVRELRKNQGLTAQELSLIAKVSSAMIRKVDNYKFKNVPDPLKSKMERVLRGK